MCEDEVRDQSFLLTRLRRLRQDRDTVLRVLHDPLFCWRWFSNTVSVSDLSSVSGLPEVLASAKDEGLLPVRQSVHACMAQMVAGIYFNDYASSVKLELKLDIHRLESEGYVGEWEDKKC